ncbi:SsrA-binding protein [Candidatus Fokinia solitaria]|uniref:SsrA-binding protein n=1 Tax=Candidatus Fokinia solitaria TaxID=1802984 RepID=A0A2U8BS10_9RICK|nr:SsrA-binding protein SmpB [Candidatus Fokinia solitaria]AWD33146.1 SsrA-binding protein [Candidatus Fokinia solitaria]
MTYKLNISKNRKAYHNYTVDSTYEAGIALRGSEVKSLRKNKTSLSESYGSLIKGELFLLNLHIPQYECTTAFLLDSRRPKKLLLHKREINRIIGKMKKNHFTIIPLEMYLNERSLIKVAIGVCKGKTNYDKRESIKKREIEREMRRDVSNQE